MRKLVSERDEGGRVNLAGRTEREVECFKIVFTFDPVGEDLG